MHILCTHWFFFNIISFTYKKKIFSMTASLSKKEKKKKTVILIYFLKETSTKKIHLVYPSYLHLSLYLLGNMKFLDSCNLVSIIGGLFSPWLYLDLTSIEEKGKGI